MTDTHVADETKRASPLELFFDLAFVFALARVTALMADPGDWAAPGSSGTRWRASYGILHLAMAAGIVLLALGVKKALGDVGSR